MGEKNGGNELFQNAMTKLFPAALALQIALGMPMAAPAELSDAQKIVAQTWSIVDATYVDRTFNNNDWFKIRQSLIKRPYAEKDEAYKAISEEMLKPLGDQYTRFIDPVKYAALRDSIVSGGKGQDVSGIGVTLSIDKVAQRVKIVDVVEGSPASEAGLKAADVIVEVNKVRTDTGSTTPEEVAALVRGPTGSKAVVKVVSGGSEKELSMDRRTVKVKPVVSGTNGKMGYIKIKQFDQQTVGLVKDALKANLDAGVNCHVIDLRDNAGGFFRAGVDTAGLFLDAGKQAVFVVNKDGVQDQFATEKAGDDTKNPVYVLVNEYTASASEIMTGALKDNGRATVVGTKTFGKGIIQTVTPLADGAGVAVTIARYETPNHIDINKKGIEPDAPLGAQMCPDPYPKL